MMQIGDKHVKEFDVPYWKIQKFAQATGDVNPIHLDDNYAKKTIFGERIAHGLLGGGFISAVLGNWFPGPGTIYLEQNMKFLKPVKINSIVRVEITILDIDKFNRATLQTDCFVKDECVITGFAKVILPSI